MWENRLFCENYPFGVLVTSTHLVMMKGEENGTLFLLIIITFRKLGFIMFKPFFWVVLLCALGSSFVHAETVLNFESTDPTLGLANVETTLTVLNTTSLEVTVKNESPVFLPGGNNLPAITGFGFDMNESDLELLEWTLSAYDYDCVTGEMELMRYSWP